MSYRDKRIGFRFLVVPFLLAYSTLAIGDEADPIISFQAGIEDSGVGMVQYSWSDQIVIQSIEVSDALDGGWTNMHTIDELPMVTNRLSLPVPASEAMQFFRIQSQTPIQIPQTGIRMVPIPQGEFIMGSDHSPEQFPFEKPETHVVITQPFWMSQYEITQKQFQILMSQNPSFHKGAGENAPVENVGRFGAVAFCEKLNLMLEDSSLIPEGYVFSLPTEAQWEYACRAGTTGQVYEIRQPDSLEVITPELDQIAWFIDNAVTSGIPVTYPVGSKAPNLWGLYDMIGNVDEWVLDAFNKYPGGTQQDYYVPPPPRPSPVRPSPVARGGSAFSSSERCRISSRYIAPVWEYYYRASGFRIALVKEK